jgi:hypothetical protein
MICEKGCHAILDEAKCHLDQDADTNVAASISEIKHSNGYLFEIPQSICPMP